MAKCRFFKREKGETNKNTCMAEMAVLGEAGDEYGPSTDEVVDLCLSDNNGFKECCRFQWVEREKDKEILKHNY